MALNPALYATLKAAILAETAPELVAYRNNGQAQKIADWYNQPKPAGAACWNSNVSPQLTDEATPWVNFDSITQAGKRDSWLIAFMRYSRDYSKNSIRKWVTDVWGNAIVGSDAYAILTNAGQRVVTRAEAVLGGNTTASTNAATAIKLTWEGFLSEADISSVLNS